MDFSDALRKAGISVTEKPKKIEKEKQTVELKVREAYKILDKIKTASGSMEVFVFYGIDSYKSSLTTNEFLEFKNYV